MTGDERLCGLVQADPHGEHWDEALQAHAASCPACSRLVAGVRQLADRLRSLPSLTAPMPAARRAAMLALLGDADAAPATLPPRRPAGRAWGRWPRVAAPLALAASLAAGMVIGHNVEFRLPWQAAEVHRDIGMYIHDVTHDHYLFERINRPLEIATSDRAALSTWLSESLNFRFVLPASTRGLSLRGGRVWHTVGRLSALAAYETAGGDRVILFAVPAHNLALDGATSAVIDGHRVYSGGGWDREARVWIDGDLAVALVAPQGRLPDDWAASFLP